MASDSRINPLTAAVDRIWPTPENLDGLFAAGESVANMRASRGWACVMAVLEDEIKGVESRLDGKLLEHAEYAHWHGVLRGLKRLEVAAEAITERAAKRQREQESKHEAGAGSPA